MNYMSHKWNVQADLKQRRWRFCSPVRQDSQPNTCTSLNHQDSASAVLTCCLQGSNCTQNILTLTPWVASSIFLSNPPVTTSFSSTPSEPHSYHHCPMIFSHPHGYWLSLAVAVAMTTYWTAVKQLLLLLTQSNEIRIGTINDSICPHVTLPCTVSWWVIFYFLNH